MNNKEWKVKSESILHFSLFTILFSLFTFHYSLYMSGELLPLMEAFYTIQGEGYYKGTAAYFIRLAGCDVGCHWCDVKESWDATAHPLVPIEQIAEQALAHSKTIIITGGEPLMYNLLPLTQLLRSHGARTHIETSGAHPLSGEWDWICLSPKKNKRPLSPIPTVSATSNPNGVAARRWFPLWWIMSWNTPSGKSPYRCTNTWISPKPC